MPRQKGWCSSTACLIMILVLSWISFILYYISANGTATASTRAPHVEPRDKIVAEKMVGGETRNRSYITAILDEKVDIHVVFSTDCSEYQDWQSIFLFYSAMAVGQPGYITRIASGCDEAKQTQLHLLYEQLFSESSSGGNNSARVNVHFTPDFKSDNATKKKYAFYNKPRGLQHFLTYYKQSVLSENAVIALTDPDMVFTRPLLPSVRADPSLIFDKRRQKITDAPVSVARGLAVAQQYGLGAPWTNDNHKWFNRGKICGEGSRCLLYTEKFASLHFSVGPPYLVHVADMRSLADTWVEFVARVYSEYPHLLAEMYAYSMASAHLGLPHFQASHYMVSNVDASGEGWEHVDALGDDVCSDVRSYKDRRLPVLLHYCQSFRVGDYGWTKRQVPKDVFTCNNSVLLRLPPRDVFRSDYRIKEKKKVKFTKPHQARRNTFMLCSLYNMLNDAIMFYNKKMCGDRRGASSFARINLQDRMT